MIISFSVAITVFALTVGAVIWFNRIGRLSRLAAVLIGVAVFVACSAAVAGHIMLSRIMPQIKLNGSSRVVIEVFSQYSDAGATAKIRNEDLTAQIKTSGKVDTEKVGMYIIEYTVAHGDKVSKILRTVEVVDTVAPQLTLNGAAKQTVSKIELFSDAGAVAADNYDGDITANIKSVTAKRSDTEYEIVYTVSDSSGNKAQASRILIIKDIVPPVITILGGSGDTIPLGSSYIERGATANDDLDGNITLRIQSSGSVDVNAAGTYFITYSVTDNAGNTATAKKTIWVYNPTDHNLSRVCLTFDDGPSTDNTVKILDILKQYDAKAIFFILNYSAEKLPIIQRIIAEGHTIGIHGYSHDYAKIYASEAAYMNNINSLREKLYNDTGYLTYYTRFPGGSSNSVKKGVSINQLINRLNNDGFRYYDWNVDSGDASGNGIPSSKIAANTISALKQGRTNMVLMHDYYTKKTTPEAVRQILEYGKSKGYVFESINEATEQIHHR